MTTLVDLAAISAAYGLHQDPSRGYLVAIAFDCLSTFASGVVFDVQQGDAQTRTFYVADNTISTIATQTDHSGSAVITNVPAGSVHLTARSLSLGATVSQTDVLVQAQRFSQVVMVPVAALAIPNK